MRVTLKKLLQWLAAILIFGPLVAILVPLLYMMAWILVLILPVVCGIVTIIDARENGELGQPAKYVPKFLLATVVLPVAIMAFAAPLRAILLAVFSFFPTGMAHFTEIHELIYAPFIPAFGDLFPYWLDLYWGIASAAVFFLISLGDSIRRSRLSRLVEILPTARVRSVAIGLAELKGKAVPLEGKAASKPIMRRWVESTNDGLTVMSHIDPFYLEDATGRILVDPRGATINGDDELFGISLHQAILRQIDKRRGLPESRLMPGDTVYLAGNVQINRERDKQAPDEIVVKPRKSSWLSMNFYDLFFISNISEEALISGLRKCVKRGWSGVVIAMAFGGWLSIFALTNITQIEASRIEAAPEYFRLISTPTTLEREIDMGALGTHPTAYFVDLVGKSDSETIDAIMKKFRDLRLAYLVLPVLERQALDIDAPTFGVANHWLVGLKAMPEGFLGFEFFGDRYVHPQEAVVLRLLTRFHDNRLFVSYRAHVGEKRKKEGDYIRRRKVVIELVNKETSDEHVARFDADFGMNSADNVEAFEFLYPGDYELHIFVETAYRSGFYNRGSRGRSSVDIQLQE